MGKRSDFERVEKDFYRSIDSRIGQALKPHIKEGSSYYEPCVGWGDLVKQLDYLNCVGSSDDEFPAEKLTEEYLNSAEYIITNPPWSRPILHQMIENLSDLRPTWLLFDADWIHTKQSVPYMKWCTDIVSVGRCIWIPETKTSGKDNCAWYKFVKDNTQGYTKFHGRVND